MNRMMEGAAAVGRLLFCAVFFWGAVGGLMPHFDAAARGLESHGVPPLYIGFRPLSHYALVAAIVALLAGSVSVAVGAKARWGAALLAMTLVPATWMFHRFWLLPPGTSEHQSAMIHFAKNAALLGGLLLIGIRGAGPFSLDHWHHQRQKDSF